jgi:exonuclease SbcC
MIKRVALRNFQIHEQTNLEFTEGMNVIAGSSDNGKSSIIRAIRWVVMNRPTGFAFHKHGAKGDTAVVVKFDDEECITRDKGEKSSGGYHYKGNVFAALRTDVPPEIQRALNLSEINIQSQHDPYFLLQDSPGEVAKKLNVVAGLGIIGDTIKKANNVVRDRKEAVGNLVKQEADYKAMFDKYSWAYAEQDNVFQLQLDVQRYKRIRDDIEAIKQGMDRREALLRKCKTISDSIGEHKAEYEQLRQEFEKINQLGCRIHELSSLAYSFRVKSRAMKAAKRLASMRQSFEAVRDTLDNYYKNRTAWGSIKRLCEWHFTAALDKAKARRQIDRGKADLELFKTEHPLCPTCNRPWEE